MERDDKGRNLLASIPTGEEVRAPDSDQGTREALKYFLGSQVLPLEEWPDAALIMATGYAYGMCGQFISWLPMKAEDYRNFWGVDVNSLNNPRVFLDLEGLAGNIYCEIILAEELGANSDDPSDFSFWIQYLSAYHLLLKATVEEIQQRMKDRKLNLKWLAYLRKRDNTVRERFLNDLTPGKEPDLSKIPEEFQETIKRHVYALPFEDRNDELSKAWRWFIDWLNNRIANNNKIHSTMPRDLGKKLGDPQILVSLEHDLKYLFAIYWSFSQPGRRNSKKGNPDNIPRLEMYTRMRNEYRRFFPPLKELPYLDGEGKQQRAWVQEESLEEMGESPEIDSDEPKDSSSLFSKDDYMKIAEIGSETDPAGFVSERSYEQSRTTKLQQLEASLTDKEGALWKILKHQAETLDKSQRGINITAAAAELDISRQMAHRRLSNIREKAKRLGLGDLL
jgi:hypothetical protein